MALVIDASIIVRWYFRDEANPRDDVLRRLGSETAVVPSHWEAEVANGVIIGERRKRSHLADVSRLVDLISDLDREVDGEGAATALARLLPLARAHRLTVYDAQYLELAERRGLPLATFDRNLATAAHSVGVEVLGWELGQ